jgi:hypothetical protein
MKTRCGFVSNSSSASFIICAAEKPSAAFFNRYFGNPRGEPVESDECAEVLEQLYHLITKCKEYSSVDFYCGKNDIEADLVTGDEKLLLVLREGKKHGWKVYEGSIQSDEGDWSAILGDAYPFAFISDEFSMFKDCY